LLPLWPDADFLEWFQVAYDKRFSLSILCSVVPASGAMSKPTISDILTQCRALIPLLHNTSTNGWFSYNGHKKLADMK